MDDLDTRLADLDAGLRALGSVLVAFSGGADSAFLLAAAVRSLGTQRVVAATAVSPSLAAAELPAARAPWARATLALYESAPQLMPVIITGVSSSIGRLA